jgi:hypothetical protein
MKTLAVLSFAISMVLLIINLFFYLENKYLLAGSSLFSAIGLLLVLPKTRKKSHLSPPENKTGRQF